MKYGAVLLATLVVGPAPRAAFPGAAVVIQARGPSHRVVAAGVPAGAAVLRRSGFMGMGGYGGILRSETPLIVIDATPRDAQVYLDDRLLGSGAQLLARAFPLPPGRHIVQIVAPGFRPYVAEFVADPPYSTRIRVSLVPQ
jgi:PEGA domain